MAIYDTYRAALAPLAEAGRIAFQAIPQGVTHNAHIFFLKVRDLDERTRLIAFLKERGVIAPFHYVPLHSSKAGRAFGRFCGEDRHTTRESERLLRLPLFYNMTEDEQARVIEAVEAFFDGPRT